MTILSIIHRTKDLQLEISFLTEAVVGNIRNCLKHQNIDHLWWCCEHMFEGNAPACFGDALLLSYEYIRETADLFS